MCLVNLGGVLEGFLLVKVQMIYLGVGFAWGDWGQKETIQINYKKLHQKQFSDISPTL